MEKRLSPRNSQKFILALQQDSDLIPFIQQAQSFVAQLPDIFNLNTQFLDIQANLQWLKVHPLTAVQFNRLVKSDIAQQDVNVYFEKFKTIFNNVQVSTQSRKILDPHCKSEQDFSSAIHHYKIALLTVLFLLLGFNRDNFDYNDEFITDYLGFIHHIYRASTISRISLRANPNIQSDVLMEIPRNTEVNVHGGPIHQHWVKVTLHFDDQDIEGYVQHSYLKTKN